MEDKLLPCPFCGTSARDDEQVRKLDDWLQLTDRAHGFYVECFGCRVEAGYFDTKEQAIAAWNRRTDSVGLRGKMVRVPDQGKAQDFLGSLEGAVETYVPKS